MRTKKIILISLLVILCLVLLVILLEATHLREYSTVKHFKSKVFGHVPVKTSIYPSKIPETTETLYRSLTKEQEHLPVDFWHQQIVKERKILRFNETCAPIPDLFDLDIVNYNWQVLSTHGASFQLLSAYLDKRKANPLGSVVRIIGLVSLDVGMDDHLQFPNIHCQIWSKSSEKPVITQIFSVDYLWRDYWGKPQRGKFHPYILTCVLPENYDSLPEAVSLVEKGCDKSRNLLKITYENERNQSLNSLKEVYPFKICVCIKPTSEINDKSLALIEWLEWLKIIGVNHVHISIYNVHENMQKVLDYYSNKGFVTQSRMYAPALGPSSKILQYLYQKSSKYNIQFDLIGLNMCLLKNMYNYDFVIPLELDEIPICKDKMPLQDVLKDKPKDFDAYSMQRVAFIRNNKEIEENIGNERNIPDFITFLRNNYRISPKEDEPKMIKCLFNTKTMVMIHNHYPFMSLRDRLRIFDMEEDLVRVEQHLGSCPGSAEDQDDCEKRKVLDMWKDNFKDEIVLNVGVVLKDLEYM